MVNENGLPTTSYGKVVTGEKSMVLGIIIWFFLGGIGLAYAGRVGLGIALFIIEIHRDRLCIFCRPDHSRYHCDHRLDRSSLSDL